MPTRTSLADEIRQLLARTREENERYSSAQYDRQSGLNNRLSAIETALVRIAEELDRP